MNATEVIEVLGIVIIAFIFITVLSAMLVSATWKIGMFIANKIERIKNKIHNRRA